MILAELTGLETASLICAIIFGGLGALIGGISFFKKQDVQISPQPLTVEMVKALHEQFANKEEVDKSLEALDSEDKALHSRIGAVDRDATKRTNEAVGQLRVDLVSTGNTMHELKGEMKQLTSQLVLVQQELQNR